MDFEILPISAIVRPRELAAAPAAESEGPRSARMGIVAPQLQVAPPVQVDPVQPERKEQLDAERGRVVPLRSAGSVSGDSAPDRPANRYKYKVAHEPDLDRPLLQIVDERTNHIVVSLPPEQLVRMLEDAKALVEDRRDSHAKNVDTTV